jgi:hypothetical protein
MFRFSLQAQQIDLGQQNCMSAQARLDRPKMQLTRPHMLSFERRSDGYHVASPGSKQGEPERNPQCLHCLDCSDSSSPKGGFGNVDRRRFRVDALSHLQILVGTQTLSRAGLLLGNSFTLCTPPLPPTSSALDQQL